VALSGGNIIEKRHCLNEVKNDQMTFLQQKILVVYLSCINARDKESRIVEFPLQDFAALTGCSSRPSIPYYKQVFKRLIDVTVCIESDGKDSSDGKGKQCIVYPLFFYGELYLRENQGWFVKLEAHPKAMSLLFDFKEHYVCYTLQNVIDLKSKNQLRLYEILKQHEFQHTFEVQVTELRAMMGLGEEEYALIEPFKRRILNPCQKIFAEKTDISFTYQRGQVGLHGKWLTIIFTIRKNDVGLKKAQEIAKSRLSGSMKPHYEKKAHPNASATTPDSVSSAPASESGLDGYVLPFARRYDPTLDALPKHPHVTIHNPHVLADEAEQAAIAQGLNQAQTTPSLSSSLSQATERPHAMPTPDPIYTVDCETVREPARKAVRPTPPAQGFHMPYDEEEEEAYDEEYVSPYKDKRIEYFADACSNSFSEVEMRAILSVATSIIARRVGGKMPVTDEEKNEWNTNLYCLLVEKYMELEMREMQTQVHSRVKYFIGILKNTDN
jgi:plasmid replication initiation protein